MEVLFEFDTITRKAKIVSLFLEQIRELFSTEDKSLIFLRRRTGRTIPVRKYAITNKGYFDLPLFEEICKVIRTKLPALKIKASADFIKAATSEELAKKLQTLDIQPRDYQQESASLAISKGKGIIVLPTSAGKTLVIALIATYISRFFRLRHQL